MMSADSSIAPALTNRFCAQRELRSSQMLQLDPAALRQPDSFDAPSHLTANGRHLAAAMSRLIDPPPNVLDDSITAGWSGSQILTRLPNRLAGLAGTGRAGAAATAPDISKGDLISCLNPAGVLIGDPDIGANDRRVVDRPDVKDLLKD